MRPNFSGIKKPGSGRVGFGGLESMRRSCARSPSPTRAPPPRTLEGGGLRHGLETKRHATTDVHIPISGNREKLRRILAARHELSQCSLHTRLVLAVSHPEPTCARRAHLDRNQTLRHLLRHRLGQIKL
jgi:hypothetical protein